MLLGCIRNYEAEKPKWQKSLKRHFSKLIEKIYKGSQHAYGILSKLPFHLQWLCFKKVCRQTIWLTERLSTGSWNKEVAGHSMQHLQPKRIQTKEDTWSSKRKTASQCPPTLAQSNRQKGSPKSHLCCSSVLDPWQTLPDTKWKVKTGN